MHHLSECPLCSNIYLEEKLLRPFDFFAKTGKYNLSECLSCGLIFTNPRPPESDIWKYYNADTYISHTRTGKTLKDRLYFAVQSLMLKRKFQLLQSYHSTNSQVLDYGCGAGAFLCYIKKKSWSVVGYEPDTNAATVASQDNIPVYSQLDQLDAAHPLPFDIVTLWHVLEHSCNLSYTMQYLYNRVKPGGFLIVAVPMADSFDCKYYKEYWAAYDVPRHLYHFTPKTLINAFTKIGFLWIRSEPMPFDAYYISLISESYKGAFAGFLRALLIGSVSNVLAFMGRSSWSSEIFVFQKPG